MAKQEAENKKAQGTRDKTQGTRDLPSGQAGKKQEESKKAAPVVQKHSHTAIDKDTKKELQKTQKQFQQLEAQIAKLNITKAELEKSLVDPSVYSSKQKFLEAETAFKKASLELKSLHADYEKVFEKIMALEQK